MIPKFSNIISSPNDYINNTEKRKKYSKRIISNKFFIENKMNNKDSKASFQKDLLNINSNKNNEVKNNINNYKYINTEVEKQQNGGNINDNYYNNDKTKSNNVTNNICIIIKADDNKKKKEEIDKKDYKYEYYNSFKKRKKPNHSISTDNINLNNEKSYRKFKKINLNSSDKNLDLNNNSFKLKKKNIMNGKNSSIIDNNIKHGEIKYKYRNRNCSILNPKNKMNPIKNIKNDYINNFIDKNENPKKILFTHLSEKYIEENGRIKKEKKNKYNESIQQKREFLGISLNKIEKNKVKREIYDEFIDYEKEKEEIERRIIMSYENIKKEENNKYYKYKKRKPPKRVFSSDIATKISYNINNKNKEKKFNKSIDTTFFNNENNISKSDISYIQTEYNRDENQKYINLIKEERNLINSNSKINDKNINIKYKKRSINLKTENGLNYKNYLNNFYINKNNSDNRFNNINTNLFNSKSYMNIFIPEEKMKKNTDIILKEMIEILDVNKSKNKNIEYKSPRKKRETIFSPPSKNEIITIQNNEYGKTLRCIKKRCKEKSGIKEEGIRLNQYLEESPRKKINIINNDIKGENKEENKKIEINVPNGEIKALRRIKNKIENYKKNQNKNTNKYYNKFKKCKSFYFFKKKKKIILFIRPQIKRSYSLNCKNKNAK